MAGRCTECGAYHYKDEGPPCQNCGAMGFAEAPKILECAECGTIHRGEGPPCNDCGAMGFRRVDNPGRYVSGATGSASAAGGSDDDLSEFAADTGSLDRRTLLYGAGIVGALGLGAYTFLTGDDYPTTTAPGEASEASGIHFATVETELRSLINEERESEGVGTVSTAENVDAFATYYNKEYVKSGGLDGANAEEYDGKFNVSDYHALGMQFGDGYEGRAIDAFWSAAELARDCIEDWMDESQYREPMLRPEWSRIGQDVHVDEAGNVFVLVIFD